MERRRAGKSSAVIERGEERGEQRRGQWRWRRQRWRFGKRTVEKPLDSCERENSAESRQTDRRWLRLTGFETALAFLPRWSSCSLIPLFPPSLPRSLHPLLSPSITGAPFSGCLPFPTSCAQATAPLFITHDLQARPQTHTEILNRCPTHMHSSGGT